MQIKVDNDLALELTNDDLKMFESFTKKNELSSDIGRRLSWVISSRLHEAKQDLLNEWMPKLKAENEFLPTSDSALLNMIFNHKDYKDKDKKVEEEDRNAFTRGQ